jgi:hypothetical protein
VSGICKKYSIFVGATCGRPLVLPSQVNQQTNGSKARIEARAPLFVIKVLKVFGNSQDPFFKKGLERGFGGGAPEENICGS